MVSFSNGTREGEELANQRKLHNQTILTTVLDKQEEERRQEGGDLEDLADTHDPRVQELNPAQEQTVMYGSNRSQTEPGQMYASTTTPGPEGMYRNDTSHDEPSRMYRSSDSGCNGCDYHP